MFLLGFSTLSTGPTEKLKGSHEGEKRVTVYEYILQDGRDSERLIERNISHMSTRMHMDAADWVVSKDAITNYCFRTLFFYFTLGTRGFSRVQREFSVLAVGRRCVGLWVTIKAWPKPETALEKSLAPRVFLFERRPNRIIEIKPSDANVCHANDSHKVKSMLKRKLPQCLVLLCALGTPWANYSAAFPEKVRQCCNAAVWQEHYKKEYIM